MHAKALEKQPRVYAYPVARHLGEALLMGFAVIILLAGMDKAEREQLESFQEITAVGDRAFFQLPADLQKPPQAVTSFRGQGLYPVSAKPVEIRDTKMIRLGKDDTGQYSVYSSREKLPAQEGEVETKDEKFFFLKLAPGEYLKTKVAAAGK